ncbi:MAG: hypothetical protein KF740_01430 [Ramlibacter sp.]|nr:hypothetical protein [Ramlibacter sp.]
MLTSLQPRIEGLPFTAPRYDELTAPVRVPVVVGCWMSETDGWCFTQQGTRLKLPRAFMASFIANGQFLDFDAGPPVGHDDSKGAKSRASERRQGPQSAE